MQAPMRDEIEIMKKELTKLVEYLLELEEIHWLERSQINWKKGDGNTKFFHEFASASRKRNIITHLKNNQCTWLEGTDVRPMILDYFVNLFSSEVHETDPNLLAKVHTHVTVEMNDMLLSPCTTKDVKKGR